MPNSEMLELARVMERGYALTPENKTRPGKVSRGSREWDLCIEALRIAGNTDKANA